MDSIWKIEHAYGSSNGLGKDYSIYIERVAFSYELNKTQVFIEIKHILIYKSK